MWDCTHDGEGQDVIEYALLVALIAILGMAVLTLFGRHIGNALNIVAGTSANAIP
ncbi:MAG TPA: Flp family type IVb pilin [Anaerolineae bacterium]|nr:Flp family type IVb pilin [Anaerolineae bacterium]